MPTERRPGWPEACKHVVDGREKLQVVLLSLSSSNLRLGPVCNSAYDVLGLPSSEKALISKIKIAAGPRAHEGHSYRRSPLPKTGMVVTGIGDDCAVLRLPAGQDLLTTTDLDRKSVV